MVQRGSLSVVAADRRKIYVTRAILFVADVLSPGANLPQLGSQEVTALGTSRGLAVDRVVGAHGGIASWADVTQAARR